MRALTLPGIESKDADGSEITLRDHRQRLSDERRYDVPATVIACEFSTARNCESGWPRITWPGGISRRSATSDTSTCPPDAGRS